MADEFDVVLTATLVKMTALIPLFGTRGGSAFPTGLTDDTAMVETRQDVG
jgi:hypothetical protein